MNRKASIPLNVVLAVLVVLRTMIAPGYMPGGEGWPVALCPDGLDRASIGVLFGHDHRHEGHGRDHHRPDKAGESQPHAGWDLESCALGATLAQAALPGAEVTALAIPAPLIPGILRPRAVADTRSELPRARSPPMKVVRA